MRLEKNLGSDRRCRVDPIEAVFGQSIRVCKKERSALSVLTMASKRKYTVCCGLRTIRRSNGG